MPFVLEVFALSLMERHISDEVLSADPRGFENRVGPAVVLMWLLALGGAFRSGFVLLLEEGSDHCRAAFPSVHLAGLSCTRRVRLGRTVF